MTHLEHGRCGACGRPATRFPSRRWEHDRRPCAARTGGVTKPTDSLPPAVFVPDGHPLPAPDPGGRWTAVGDHRGIPEALAWIPAADDAQRWDRIRGELADDAENRSPTRD